MSKNKKVPSSAIDRQDSKNVNLNQGANYICTIPGLNVLPTPLIDNSPSYNLPISAI